MRMARPQIVLTTNSNGDCSMTVGPWPRVLWEALKLREVARLARATYLAS